MLLLALGEILARQPWVQAKLPPASLSGPNAELSLKVQRLDALAREGPVACIAVGSSAVRHGFDPAAFSAGYHNQAGTPLPCFNFGMDGYTASGTAALAEALIRRYRPALLLYLTTPSDASVPFDDIAPGLDAPAAWVRWQRGELSPGGWLIEHSMLFRDAHSLGWWLGENSEGYIRTWYNYDGLLTPDGFFPSSVVRESDAPPDPATSPIQFAILDDYRINPADRAGLEQIVGLHGSAQVVLVEIPISDQALAFFDGGAADIALFLDTVREIGQAAGVPFWEQPRYELIPPGGWHDYLHLNRWGASAFSDWLGQRTGSAVMRGEIEDPAQ